MFAEHTELLAHGSAPWDAARQGGGESFSPARSWGQLGPQAGPTLHCWVHHSLPSLHPMPCSKVFHPNPEAGAEQRPPDQLQVPAEWESLPTSSVLGSRSVIEDVGGARANDEAQGICVLYGAQVAKPVDSAGDHWPPFTSCTRRAVHFTTLCQFSFFSVVPFHFEIILKLQKISRIAQTLLSFFSTNC